MFKGAYLSHAKHVAALNPFESLKAFQTEQEFCTKAKGLCDGVFMGRFIFRYICQALFRAKMMHAFEV